jgi:hypothetical protein
LEQNLGVERVKPELHLDQHRGDSEPPHSEQRPACHALHDEECPAQDDRVGARQQHARRGIAESGESILGSEFAKGARGRLPAAEDAEDQRDREGFRSAAQAEGENPGVVAAGDRRQRLDVAQPWLVKLRTEILEQRPGGLGHDETNARTRIVFCRTSIRDAGYSRETSVLAAPGNPTGRATPP